MFCITFDNFACGKIKANCPFPDVIPAEEWNNYNEIGLTVGHPRILQLLDQLDIKGTFFAEGYSAVLHPDWMKRWRDAGHEIGLHGWKHEMWTTLPDKETEDQLVALGVAAMTDLLGEAPLGFRPPGMRINPWTDDVMKKNGIQYIAQITESRSKPRFAEIGIPYSEITTDLVITEGKILVCTEDGIDGRLISPEYGGFFGEHSADEAYEMFYQRAFEHESKNPDQVWTFIIHPHISGSRSWFALAKFLKRLHAEFGPGTFKKGCDVALGG